jgi:hypothetical protein
MVTANLRMMTSRHLIKFYRMSELPSGIDVNQVMSGTGHLRNCRRYQSQWRDSEGPRALSVLIESEPGSSILIEHDLFGKPASAFPDHALIRQNLFFAL